MTGACDMSVEEAQEFFTEEFDIMRSLTALIDVGLGYLRLGQPASMLAGGEGQRVKLARELARKSSGQSLYVLHRSCGTTAHRLTPES